MPPLGPPQPSRDFELAQTTLASIGEGVIRTDAMGRVDYMNPVAEKLTGWKSSDAEGCDISEVYQVLSEVTRRPRPNPVSTCLAERRTLSPPGLFTLKGRRGDELTIRDTISPLVAEDDELLGTVVLVRDLTQMRTLEREMAYITSHDRLTGLLNRQEFEIYLEVALESARDRGSTHSLLHLDLMELKLVNDCFGHIAGDELLRHVALRIRETAPDNAVVARIGGSDFTTLLEEHDTRSAEKVARDLQRDVAQTRFSWGGQHFEVGFHIGIVTLDPDCPSVLQLLQAADTASYQARQSGRDNIHVGGPASTPIDDRQSRLHWVQRIRRALSGNRFVLYRQRIEPLAEGQPPLNEVLVRMLGDDGEVVLPGLFIPVAEEHDLITLLDRWVLRRTLELLRDGHLGNELVTVNLSGQSLGDEAFLEDLCSSLDASGVDPERLYFEITETHAVANLARALKLINTLRRKGCGFVLDDFGSGFSSFGYLKNLPVDILKIDGQFVRDLVKDPVSRAMVSSINEIAHLMSLRTIAEWVEDAPTLEAVRDLGVDLVQGFHLHRPEIIAGPL